MKTITYQHHQLFFCLSYLFFVFVFRKLSIKNWIKLKSDSCRTMLMALNMFLFWTVHESSCINYYLLAGQMWTWRFPRMSKLTSWQCCCQMGETKESDSTPSVRHFRKSWNSSFITRHLVTALWWNSFRLCQMWWGMWFLYVYAYIYIQYILYANIAAEPF